MTRREIDRKFDEIVDFAGVEKFLDTPVKRYSSGMQVRLAFAVAAHLEPEILIIDEVLAVGDAEFQKKCLGKMQDVAAGGRTVLFVSHNMAAVESLCTRAIVLADGRISISGDAVKTVSSYLSHFTRVSDEGGPDVDLEDHPNRRSGSTPILTSLKIFDSREYLRNTLSCAEPIRFRLEFHNDQGVPGLFFAVFICHRGTRLCMFHSLTHSGLSLNGARDGSVQCSLESLPLVPCTYDIDVAVGVGGQVLDYIESCARIIIQAGDLLGTGRLPSPSQGLFVHRSSWTCDLDLESKNLYRQNR